MCDTSKVNYNVELQPFGFDYKFTTTLREKPVRKEESRKEKKKQKKCKTDPALFFLCLFFSLPHPFVFSVETRINYAVFIVMLLS